MEGIDTMKQNLKMTKKCADTLMDTLTCLYLSAAQSTGDDIFDEKVFAEAREYAVTKFLDLTQEFVDNLEVDWLIE